jgi:electron transfer flavoprotein alpha subunit
MSLLVIAEHDNASLKTATLNAVAAAAKIGGDIHVLVAGSGCGAVAEQARRLPGWPRCALQTLRITVIRLQRIWRP